MRTHTRRPALALIALGVTLAACAADAPTDTRGQNPPTHPSAPGPVPTPVPMTEFPQLTRAGAIYYRTTASFIPGESRYVIYDDGTFSLQYLRPDWGFFEYPGRYLRADSVLTLDFNDADTAGLWQARGVFAPDATLTVAYNAVMIGADFEDGKYGVVKP
jgi:hypothetical protein